MTPADTAGAHHSRPTAVAATPRSGPDNTDRALLDEQYQFICALSGENPGTDLFASPENAKCDTFYTVDTDCMKAQWGHSASYANPPFIAPRLCLL